MTGRRPIGQLGSYHRYGGARLPVSRHGVTAAGQPYVKHERLVPPRAAAGQSWANGPQVKVDVSSGRGGHGQNDHAPNVGVGGRATTQMSPCFAHARNTLSRHVGQIRTWRTFLLFKLDSPPPRSSGTAWLSLVAACSSLSRACELASWSTPLGQGLWIIQVRLTGHSAWGREPCTLEAVIHPCRAGLCQARCNLEVSNSPQPSRHWPVSLLGPWLRVSPTESKCLV
jgi:hypothetical protein